MVTHNWSSSTDWSYCSLTNCKISNGTIILDNSLTGTVLSDIRDSTSRLSEYNEILPKITLPSGCSALLYIRTGYFNNYTVDTWTDWQLINDPVQILEYTLSLSSAKIIVDYDIKTLINIYHYDDYKFQEMRNNLKMLYLSTLDPNVISNDPKYSSLWASNTNRAIVNFAKVGYDGEVLTTYATDTSIINNTIILKNKLPSDNTIVIIKYIPRNFIYSDYKGRYIQWKLELSSESLIRSPIIRTININYTLDIYNEVANEFARFYRRI